MRIGLVLMISSVLMFSCTTCRRNRQMESLLMEAKQQNENYQPFSTDSVMKEVVAYYDLHGSSNEQLTAHYLLGCVYRDLGEEQQSLKCYLDAVSCADTTDAECDYSTLCKVYGQMALLFLDNEMPQNALEALDAVIRYSRPAKDTLIMLQAYENKANAYYYLGKSDSVVSIREHVSKLFTQYGFKDYAALALGPAIQILVERGDFAKAKKYIHEYEHNSGVFDSEGNIEKGREIYYTFKGEYYLGTEEYDSAEYYFRKCLSDGNAIEVRAAAFSGMLSLYNRTGVKDSTVKYAVLCSTANDSIYSRMVSTDLQRMQSKYNYSRKERQAHENAIKVEHLRTVVYVLAVLFILSLSILIIRYFRGKRKTVNLPIQESTGHDRNAVPHEIEADAQDSAGRNGATGLPSGKTDSGKSDVEMKLHASEIYLRLKSLACRNIQPSNTEWAEARKLINEVVPSFYDALNGHGYKLRDDEYDICILIRLNFAPYELCALTGKTASYMSMIRQRMLKKVFNETGKPKDFDRRISEIY